MRKSASRKFSFAIALALIITCFSGITSFAFINGYNNATEYTSAITSYITSTSQNDWYKFTITADEVPTAYSITLKIPDDCVYNFDLRYRATDSTSRPSIISNETIVNGSRSRKMTGVFTDVGTYFVRVYSQNGTTNSSESYRLTISYNKNSTHGFNYGTGLPSADVADWSVCADMLGNYTFDNNIKYATNNRTYQNAYTFIMSNYESDSASEYSNEDKASPEQTAIASDYIYSGDIMLNPKFKVETGKIYEIEELMYYVWGLNEPIIFYLDNTTYQLPIFTKYVILRDVNIGNNTITYYYPNSGNTVTVDYDDFLTDGITYATVPLTYRGTNIVDANSVKAVQPIYN